MPFLLLGYVQGYVFETIQPISSGYFPIAHAS